MLQTDGRAGGLASSGLRAGFYRQAGRPVNLKELPKSIL